MSNIILIGFMGSGKSTVADCISDRLNCNSVDTDVMIEESMKITINEIFDRFGEEYFRNLETDVIKDISKNFNNTVISVGGGLPVKEANRTYLKDAGKVVYLKASVDTLVERLANDNTRPLLRGENLRLKVENLMKARESIYEEVAEIVINTDDLTVEEVVSEIINAID